MRGFESAPTPQLTHGAITLSNWIRRALPQWGVLRHRTRLQLRRRGIDTIRTSSAKRKRLAAGPGAAQGWIVAYATSDGNGRGERSGPDTIRVKVRTRVGVGRSALLAATAGQQGCVRRPADRDGRARRREGPAGRVLRQAAWSRSGMAIRSGPTQARSDDLIWRATAESGETCGGPARRRPTPGQ